jgi:hypothetical protein
MAPVYWWAMPLATRVRPETAVRCTGFRRTGAAAVETPAKTAFQEVSPSADRRSGERALMRIYFFRMSIGIRLCVGPGSVEKAEHRLHAYCNNYSGSTMSDQDLKAELERLKAENAALKQRGPGSIKVSEKGAVSVYGLGRFPVTLYKEQWEKLLSMAGEIKTFMAEHDSQLKKKE